MGDPVVRTDVAVLDLHFVQVLGPESERGRLGVEVLHGNIEGIAVGGAGHKAGRGGPVGIVTMKDLAEELLGELAEW